MTEAVTDRIEDFAAALPERGRLLGLDLGTKTIGIAVSDPERHIASPRETLRRTKFRADADALARLSDSEEIAGLVIGLPVNMNGTEGPRAQSSRAFAGNIAGRLGLPVLLWDERLSTAAVTRTMLDADLSRRRRGEVVDKLAAAYILQGALDGLAARAKRIAD
jgi:putative Holliday junction resolvase